MTRSPKILPSLVLSASLFYLVIKTLVGIHIIDMIKIIRYHKIEITGHTNTFQDVQGHDALPVKNVRKNHT